MVIDKVKRNHNEMQRSDSMEKTSGEKSFQYIM